MKTLSAPLVVLLVAIGACTTHPDPDPTYGGEYFYNFESSYFTPDGKSQEWCIDAGTMRQAMLPAKDANGRWGTSHIEVRGKLGPEGKYGALGRCSRILVVTELVTVSNMRGRE
jgi:hypothetical protein